MKDVPDDWDIVVSGVAGGRNPEKVTNRVVKVQHFGGLQLAKMRPRTVLPIAQKYIDDKLCPKTHGHVPNAYGIDRLFGDHLNVYVILPFVSTQLPNTSDLEACHKNYNTYFSRYETHLTQLPCPLSPTSPLVYRLADTILGSWKAEKDKMYHLAHFPNSLVAQYFARTAQTSDMETLSEVVKNNLYRVPNSPANTVVVHLRLGDVLNPPYMTSSVKEYVDHAIPFCASGYDPVLYIQPASYFLTQLKMYSSCTNIQFVFGNHKHVEFTNSKEYVTQLTQILTHNGYTCSCKQTTPSNSYHAADLDFLYLCKAKHFLPSGGGFSQLANKMNMKMQLEK